MHSKDHCKCTTHKVFLVFTSCCLVTASNGGRYPSFVLPNCPRPLIPALSVGEIAAGLRQHSLEIHDQDFYSFLDMYNGASSTANGRSLFLCRRYVCCTVVSARVGGPIYTFLRPTPKHTIQRPSPPLPLKKLIYNFQFNI
jgi:hypothetical protein